MQLRNRAERELRQTEENAMRLTAARATVLCAVLVPALVWAENKPFDEVTLDRIQELNQAINDHYLDLQTAVTDIDERRKITQSRLETIQEELGRLDSERSAAASRRADPNEMRALEENRLEAKSRYLEALAEQHAIDVESTQAFEVHATAILQNLERLADELKSSQSRVQSDPAQAAQGLHSLQRGTAIALTVLEDWGVLEREDPRFRALWATARVLNRSIEGLSSTGWSEGIRQTVDLVQERIFVVRSLVDQVRAIEPALDQKGLLLQVAAQNQMLQLYSTNLGVIDGLELPDLQIEESIERIIADIEETPGPTRRTSSRDPLSGLDDCANNGVCE
jgi:hypothetical protein